NGGLRGGRIRVRATISKRDKRTLVIEDIPYGETTDSVKSSIAAACEKGKIKIKKFDDYTSDKVEIVLQLHNDISPDKTIDALYAFTKCAVTISPNTVVIKDGRPEFMTVNDVLRFNTFHTRDLLLQELNVQLCELEEDWHRTSLEKIFFEKKVYRVLENDARSWDDQVDDVTSRMLEYQHLVHRSITKDDILKLVEKPVRKISKFDIKAAEDLLANIETKIEKVKYNIEHITEYAIEHFKTLKKKYGAKYPRHTRIEEFEDIQVQTVAATNAKLYANRADGFVGTDAKKIDGAEYICDCSDIDAVIAFMKNGDYIVTDVKDKAFIGKDIIHVAIFKKGDERTVYNAIYRDGKDGIYYAKRFAITGITKNKLYNLTIGTAGSTVIWFTANANGEAETVRVQLRPRPKLKKLIDFYDFSALGVKGRASRGNVVSRNPVQRITLKSKGVSTIGGKPIWFDNDINRLNDAQRGLYLGEFEDGEHILTILKNGHFYTTSFDLSNRYQGDIKIIEKLDADTTWSALYFDKESGFFYLKRFSFEVSDNTDQCFIAESNGSYLVELSRDVYPQVKVTFTGKNASREPEIIDVAEFIGKKGFKAKGKRVSSYEVGSVEFIEPLPVPEVEIEEESAEEEATLTDMQKEDMQGEEPMSQPVVEAPLKVKKIAWEAEGEIAPAGETEEDDAEASPKGEGGTIELTLF
ncbi:MAG: DNA gyrase/topoisomerase IV subunit A, partial [Bacteroidales bacterium]|nr:DNA gyrase/topoisomerase IV subunit A [Bacteroidales bacterium]